MIKKIVMKYFFPKFIKILGRIICILQYNQASEKSKELLPSHSPKLAEYLQMQKEDDGLYHNFSHYKLYELSKFLYNYKPKTILELGGGSTTSAFVEYAINMSKNGVSIKIISVDESVYYQNQTKMLLQKIFSMENIDKIDLNFFQSDRQEDAEGCFYKDIINITSKLGTIDLVYVDGPSAPKRIPCKDVILIKSQIINVLFDHRTPSVLYCEKYFKSTHSIARYYSINNDIWIADKYRHHSTFLKKNII